MQGKAKLANAIFLAFYLFLVFYLTVLGRSQSFPAYNTTVFWSYREWIEGNWKTGIQIIENIILFIPIGYLYSRFFSKGKRAIILTVLFCAIVSFAIEHLQLDRMRGLFEYDDIINNTFGGLIGSLGYQVISEKINLRIAEKLTYIIGMLSLLGMVYVVLTAGENADASCQMYCFQIDEISENTVRGVAFQYEKPPQKFTLLIKETTTGTVYEIERVDVENRDDVNEYFDCEYDYTLSGFRAYLDGINNSQEYEFLINWGWKHPISTGVFFTGNDIHYAPQISYHPEMFYGTDFEIIARNGDLRIYRPDIPCYVYQYDGYFYWVFGKDYHFDDNNTLIQYQLWTTQYSNLPSERISEGDEWDNKTDFIERYEVAGNFGDYRVFRRKIPTEYAISSVLTGYYKPHKWYWQSYFRPIFNFELQLNGSRLIQATIN